MKSIKLKNVPDFVLLWSLFAILITPILTSAFPKIAAFFINLMSLTVVVSGISILSREFRLHRIVRFLLMLVLAASVINFFDTRFPLVEIIVGPLISVYLFILTLVLVNMMLKVKSVSTITLIHAMCGYLLLGLSGSILMGVIEANTLNAYSTHLLDTYGPFGKVYHSFVTLSTLGYGDISPTNAVSQSFAVVLAVSGVFYMSFLVATLIGVFISDKKS